MLQLLMSHVTFVDVVVISVQFLVSSVNSCGFHSSFLPARRYASAGYSDRNVSVCPSVRLSVRHAPVLCQNEES